MIALVTLRHLDGVWPTSTHTVNPGEDNVYDPGVASILLEPFFARTILLEPPDLANMTAARSALPRARTITRHRTDARGYPVRHRARVATLGVGLACCCRSRFAVAQFDLHALIVELKRHQVGAG